MHDTIVNINMNNKRLSMTSLDQETPHFKTLEKLPKSLSIRKKPDDDDVNMTLNLFPITKSSKPMIRYLSI